MFLEASIEYRLCLCVRRGGGGGGGISSGRVYVHVVNIGISEKSSYSNKITVPSEAARKCHLNENVKWI